MDRLEAMQAFVLAVEEGSLAAAGRRLGRSPAAMTRALEFLEQRLGARLLQRTTRAQYLTQAGERYLATCRRVLAELAAAERDAARGEAEPRGLLTLTSPATFGRLQVRPMIDGFLETHPGLSVRLLLLDRVANLLEEGIEAAIRIGHLPDSSLTAVKLGEVRRLVVASPAYLARAGRPRRPQDLRRHRCIVFSGSAADEVWVFAGARAGRQRVRLQPRLNLNDAQSAVASAAEGHGITRVLSYQAERELREGRLLRLLKEFEPPPLPVQIVTLPARPVPARLGAFTAFAVPALRAVLKKVEEAVAAKRG